MYGAQWPRLNFDVKKTNTNNYAKVYSTADPKSDENSDETLNLVIITELVKLLECREDTIGKLILVVVLQVPLIKMMNLVLKMLFLDLS